MPRTEAKSLKPPYRALWEITRKCDLKCAHCLVHGGKGGDDELSTDEALDLVDQMADLGMSAVSLTGGEPLLRNDWVDIAARVRDRGMILRFSMNGHLLDDAALKILLDLQTEHVAVSIDGTRQIHDLLRLGPEGSGRRRSSFDKVVAAIDRLRPTGIITSVITAVTRLNLAELPAVHELLKAHGVDSWMIQLAHFTGRLSKGPETDEFSASLPLAPEQLLDLSGFLVEAAEDPVLAPRVHNSIGYMGATEPILRQSGRESRYQFWRGCVCGKRSIGIEPDGGIKGCANQVGAPFVVGNIREERLETIWADRARWHWLDPVPEQMTGHCKGCALAKICAAGCTALAFGATGKLFDNPYCLRKIEQRARSRNR